MDSPQRLRNPRSLDGEPRKRSAPLSVCLRLKNCNDGTACAPPQLVQKIAKLCGTEPSGYPQRHAQLISEAGNLDLLAFLPIEQEPCACSRVPLASKLSLVGHGKLLSR